MREILFRGKRTGSREWIEGFVVSHSMETMCLFVEKKSRETWYVNDDTVGQYTGLTDKNGKKIFEGDIVKYTDKDQDKSTHKVFWSDTRLAFYACYTRYPELYGYASNFNKDDIEVIGNIHDNPELLKEGEG